ncbi:GTPase IMAP family member 8-like [Chanos chanos]|uniref:GTPase IMAP family member 8-like n=1 Tax=Chanos chanos TaxID=29144 RepID=A0A6J2WBL5_CHACN|nr:GTPase IMAP family member 8-like [Chanos chanos]
MATDGVVSENDSSSSEFRIVLLGPNRAEKTSVGNTILGEEKFNLQTAAQCVKKEGEVGGRHVTVVDTPGWWSGHHTEYTLNQIKEEITLSGSLCAPGPHAFLLVLPIQTVYREKNRAEVEEHMRLLGEGVWNHTLVLFTKGDSLGERTIEQYIESKGRALQWLIKKCGNRYHVFNNMNRADDSQVTELMEKIEKMVAVNSGLHYEIEKKGLHERGEQNMGREEELPSDEGIDLTRKKEELDIMQTGKRTVTVDNDSPKSRRPDCIPDKNHSRFPDLRIVLLGSKEAGKTSAGNTILGEEVFNPGTTPQCVKKEGEVAGRHVTVVDTPGWSSYLRVKHTTDEDKQETSLSGSLCSPGPHAFLLIIPVKILYTKTQRAVVEEHMKLLGEGVWNHTLVLFTKGDSLRERTIEQYIESKGRALQWLIKKCGNRYHVFNNMNRADDSQVSELMEKIEKMVAVNSGLHYEIEKKGLHETVEQNVGREEELPPDEGIDLTGKKEELDIMQTGKRTVTVGNDSPKSRRPDCIPHMGGENTSMRYTTMSESQMSLDSTTSSGYGSENNSSCPEFRIVLLGFKEAGKTSAGNTILGKEEFNLGRTPQCVKREGEVAGRHVTVVDTPGWWSNLPVECTSLQDKRGIVLGGSLCPPGPHVFLLVVPVRLSYSEQKRAVLEEHLELLGDGVWKHILVLFSFGDWLEDVTIEKHIEAEATALQRLIEKCGNRYHVFNNMNRADDSQVTELMEKIEKMVAGNNGLHYKIENQ